MRTWVRLKPKFIAVCLVVCTCLATLITLHNNQADITATRRNGTESRNKYCLFNQTLINETTNYSDQFGPIPSGHGRLEVRHIAFLKVHKAASSTIQNILYRFGLSRRLSFVLPKWSHYISTNKNVYKAVYPPCTQSEKYDILCNHAVFNEKYFRRFLHPDAVYVAIVREPLSLFESAAMYYKFRWRVEYLQNMDRSTFMEDLITHPEIYEPVPLSESCTFNSMSRDFGWVFSSVLDSRSTPIQDFDSYLNYIDSVFDIVLVVERFDESLILLKRRLSWTTRDILYLKQNARKKRLTKYPRIKNETIDLFEQLNRFDYRLYDLFMRKLEKLIMDEKNLQEEVESFKTTRLQVEHFCLESNNTIVTIDETPWNEGFDLLKDGCNLMVMDELTFYATLKSLYYGSQEIN